VLLDTSLVNAPKQTRVTTTVAPLVARNVTSAAKSVILLVIVLRAVTMEVVMVLATATVVVSRLVTLVVALGTWPVIAPRDRSATTAVKSATSLVTVLQRPKVSASATSASNPAMSRLLVPTERVGIF